jgi:hypothetical protein
VIFYKSSANIFHPFWPQVFDQFIICQKSAAELLNQLFLREIYSEYAGKKPNLIFNIKRFLADTALTASIQ